LWYFEAKRPTISVENAIVLARKGPTNLGRSKMTQLFRGMREDASGLPQIGESSRSLGVRAGFDVPASDLDNIVQRGQGGMSVSPDDALNLPYFRRRARWHQQGSRMANLGSGPRAQSVLSCRPGPTGSRLRGTDSTHDAGRIPAGIGANATSLAKNLIGARRREGCR